MKEQATIAVAKDGVELLEAAFDRHVYERHMHATYAIGATLHGVQRFWCRGATHDSVAGRVMIIGPGEVHDGESGARGGYRYRMLYVPIARVTEALRDAWSRDVGGVEAPAPLVDDAALAARISRAFAALFAHERSEPLFGEALLDDVLTELAARAHRIPLPRATTVCSGAVERVRDHLHAHLDASISVAELASIASLSRFQLTRQFRRAFGLPLHAYHLHLRLEDAKRRLERGERIAGVAAALGFADQSHLHRRFRGCYGVTPDAWRRAARGSNTRASR